MRTPPPLSESGTPSKSAAAREREYRAESDMHTLMEADRILEDAARIKAVKELAEKHHAAISSLVGDMHVMHAHHKSKGK
jgi:hypothetical protein